MEQVGGFGIIEVLICSGSVLLLLVIAAVVIGVVWYTQRSKNRGG